MDCEKVHFLASTRYEQNMTRAWILLSGASVMCAVGLLSTSCGTDASGISACRKIEQHRCNIIAGCPGGSFNDTADVTACELFYRDQCLHGLADGAAPGHDQVTACIAALDQARSCQDASTTVAECASPPETAQDVSLESTGCHLLFRPEDLVACEFLLPAPEDAGTGGAASTSSAGGAGGA